MLLLHVLAHISSLCLNSSIQLYITLLMSAWNPWDFDLDSTKVVLLLLLSLRSRREGHYSYSLFSKGLCDLDGTWPETAFFHCSFSYCPQTSTNCFKKNKAWKTYYNEVPKNACMSLTLNTLSAFGKQCHWYKNLILRMQRRLAAPLPSIKSSSYGMIAGGPPFSITASLVSIIGRSYFQGLMAY